MGLGNENRVRLDIEFDGKVRTLEVNPENLVISRSASNADINIIGLGPATRKGQPGLISMEIKSFFPSYWSPFHKYDLMPEDYINFIYDIWETENVNNKVAKLVTTGLDINFSMWFVIENFNYEYRGGEKDIYYTLSIKEYVPYGVSTAQINEDFMAGMAAGRPVSTNVEDGSLSSTKTYVVSKGDSLWSIAKRCTGNGNNWQALYELNKDLIGSGTVIEPGMTLVLPDGWNSPAKVVNKKASQTKPKTKTISATETIPTGLSTKTVGNSDYLIRKNLNGDVTVYPVDYTVPQYLQTINVSNSKANGSAERWYYMKRRDMWLDSLTTIQTIAIKRELTPQEAKNAQYYYNGIKSYDMALSKNYTNVVLNKDGTLKSYST